MTDKTFDCRAIQPLLALRVTDDLHADESLAVDQHVRYCEACRTELAALTQAVRVLQEASAQPQPTDASPSLWSRIEPRLGPAGKWRRATFAWISTRQLAAACIVIAVATILLDWSGQPPRQVPLPQPPPLRQSPPLIPVVVGGIVETRPNLGIAAFTGSVVAEVEPGSAADQLGLRVGDVIISVDDTPVRSANDLKELVSRTSLGSIVRFQWIRGSQLMAGYARLRAP
jgi:hypothetical protein